MSDHYCYSHDFWTDAFSHWVTCSPWLELPGLLWSSHHLPHPNYPFHLLVFFFTSRAILNPSSMNSTTFSKSASLNCLEVRAGAPGNQRGSQVRINTEIKHYPQNDTIPEILLYLAWDPQVWGRSCHRGRCSCWRWLTPAPALAQPEPHPCPEAAGPPGQGDCQCPLQSQRTMTKRPLRCDSQGVPQEELHTMGLKGVCPVVTLVMETHLTPECTLSSEVHSPWPLRCAWLGLCTP